MSDLPVTRETLHSDVQNLNRSIQALKLTLESDYPTRQEVRNRRVQVILAMVIAIVASYFVTVATISYCFLQGIPEDDTKKFCYIFPGYEESFDNNRQFRSDYLNLREEIIKNRERLSELEAQK